MEQINQFFAMEDYVFQLPDVFVSATVERAFLTGAAFAIFAVLFAIALGTIVEIIFILIKRKGKANGTD